MSRSDSNRRFEATIEIAAPPETVWDAISTVVGLRRWFPSEAEVTPGVGGEVVWRWSDLHTWKQTIEVWEPGARLKTRYDSSVDDGAGGQVPLFVDFQIDGEGGQTTLRLVQSGFGPEATFDAEYDGISRGWPVELRSLRLYAEKHAGTDRQLAWSIFDIDLPHADAWQRLTGAGGFACGAGIDELREGEPFRIEAATGDVFEGTVLECHKHEFSGVARNHGDGFFRFTVEDCGGRSQVWVWLATYGQPAGQRAALQRRWEAMLERMFAKDRATAAQ